ncbi:hypothetical protein D3C75_1309110 [compost metagenome]
MEAVSADGNVETAGETDGDGNACTADAGFSLEISFPALPEFPLEEHPAKINKMIKRLTKRMCDTPPQSTSCFLTDP